MNFHHLRAFYEVSRAGSISGGAERMHVSQPGVTREIKELEEQLGFMLFDRLPRGVSLTQAGTLLFDYAGRIFALSEAVEQELKQIAGFSKGHLKIGASATVGVYLAPDIIAEFNARYPKVSVELTVTNTEKVEKGLQNHEFALGLIEGPYDDTTLHTRCIGVDEIVAVAATGHPQAGRTLSARELANQAVILREPGSGTRAMVEEAYARVGLHMEPVMSVGNTEAIKRLLVVQQAIAYVSSLSVKDEVCRGDLTVLEVADLRIDRALHMVWLKGRSPSPGTRAFFELALQYAASDVPQALPCL